MTAHFEIVQTDAEQPWHARFVAANGEVVWSTENYADVRGAEGAIEGLIDVLGSVGLSIQIRRVDLRTSL